MTTKQWHVSDWSPLGWLETGIKLLAHVAAIIALVNALSSGTRAAPQGTRLIEVIVLGILALFLLLAIVDRYQDREIIAMAFVLVNVVAHWGMVYVLLTTPGPGSLLLIFALLMMIGDLVKIRWLFVSRFTSRGLSTQAMVGLVSMFVVGYLILVLLSLAGG
jgi:hypothetical protein